MQQGAERVILVGLNRPTDAQETLWDVGESLDELARLVDTAGGVVVDRLVQTRSAPDPRCYIGRGKLLELKARVEEHGATHVVFDDELTPTQADNLGTELGVPVVDRTQVILDIFAQRARTREGRLQVELAQLEYMLPRLVGKGTELSRLGGGIGTRGPGETRLEVDRRRIRKRIADLKREVDEVRKHRSLQRSYRKRALPPVVALVGYTNAGKSTLLSALTGAEVFIEDRLFATLDPTIRAVSDRPGRGFLLVDTVGFINKLPHQLIAAFRATLEEVQEADLILHVVDVSSPRFDGEIATVRHLLHDLGVVGKPVVTALNKIDRVGVRDWVRDLAKRFPNGVPISARTGEGLADLVDAIEAALPEPVVTWDFAVPYQKGDVVDWLHQFGKVLDARYEADGVRLSVEIPRHLAERVRAYRMTEIAPPKSGRLL